MSIQEVADLWERFKAAEAIWDDPEPMVALHTEDVRLNDGAVRGREALRRFELAYRRAFPDWHREYLEVVVGEECVAFRWRARGTHLGRLFGHEPTGRSFDVTGASFMRVADGLFVESHVETDPRALWEQLGLPVP